MKLTFLGTRGEIEARTPQHKMHTSLLVSFRARRVMIDCGLDWLGKFERLHPDAIVLTHAHPDHAWGLRNGASCPVHAPDKTWQILTNCRVEDRHLIKERVPTRICGITFEAFPVEHSILAPAVGYRISAGRACIFYGPDLLLRRRNDQALVRPQTWRQTHRACARSHAARLVRERGRAAGDHYSLR